MPPEDRNTVPRTTVDYLYNGLVACWPNYIFGGDQTEEFERQASWGSYRADEFLHLTKNIVALALGKTVGGQQAANQVKEWKRIYDQGEYPSETVPPELDKLVEDLDLAEKNQPRSYKTKQLAKQTLLKSQQEREKLEEKLEKEGPPTTPSETEELPPGVEEELESHLSLSISPSTASGISTLLAKIILFPTKILFNFGGYYTTKNNPELRGSATANWLIMNGITGNQILSAVRAAEKNGVNIDRARIQQLVAVMKSLKEQKIIVSHFGELAVKSKVVMNELGLTQAQLADIVSMGKLSPASLRGLQNRISRLPSAPGETTPPSATVPTYPSGANVLPLPPKTPAAGEEAIPRPPGITAAGEEAPAKHILRLLSREAISPKALSFTSAASGEFILVSEPTTNSYYLPPGYFSTGIVGSLAKNVVGRVASKFLEKGLKKVVSSVAKSAITSATKTAVATGVETAVVGGAEAAVVGAGVAAGPPGWVAAAVVIIEKVVSFILKKLKELIPKIAVFLTGEKNKELRWLALGSALVGGFVLISSGYLLIGVPLVTIGGLGILGQLSMSAQGIATSAAGFGQSIIIGLTTVVLPSIVAPVVISLVAIPIIITIIVFIINAGAYVVPPGTSVTSMYGVTGVEAQSESQYMRVEKVPDRPGPFRNSELPLTITYTITITAKEGVLTNIQFENTYAIVQDPLVAPIPNPPMPDPPDEISPASGPYTLTYTYTYGTDFADSIVSDSFKVTADAPERPWDTAIGTAIIKIGDPPEDCPDGWPIGPEGGESQLAIVQGPRGSYSHSSVEAIDISATQGHTITARHSGIATVVYTTNVYGPAYVDIASTCNGIPFTSRYAHLSTVGINNNQTVTLGQAIGTSGTDGTGPHLHYEFRGLPMAPPNIPKSIPYGCGSGCGTIP